MKKEFWYEEMRLSLKRIKKNKLTLGSILEEKKSFDAYFSNLIRVVGSQSGINVDKVIPHRVGFFRRLLIWIKSFREIF